MDFLSFICIPVNMCIMYFIGDPSRAATSLMSANPERWNSVSVILLFVGVEHLLIAAKLVLGQAIPDVP